MLVKVGQFSLLALSTLACMAKASPVPAEDVSPRWLNVPDDPSAFKPRGMRDILRRLLPSPSSGSSEPTETATTVSEIAATTTIEVPTPTSISDPVPTPTVDPKIKRAKLFIQNGDEARYYLSSTLNQAAFATTNQVEGALVFSYDSAHTGLQNFGITGYDKYPVIVATLFEQPLVDGPYDGTTATAFLQPGTAVAAGSTPQHVPTQYDNQVMIETRSESAIFTVGAPDALGKSPVSTSFINPDGKVVKQEVVFTYFPQYQDNTGGFSIAGSTWLDGPFGEFVRPPYRRGQLYLEDA